MQPSAAPPASPTATPSCPPPRTYVVKPGDTLTVIASRHGVTVRGLLAANPQIIDPNLVRTGERITISPIDLGTVGHFSGVSAINDRGQIVGATDSSGAARPFLWQDGMMTDLGTLGGDGDSWANDINEHGQIVGTAEIAGGSRRAFLWQDGIMTDLGTLPGDDWSSASAINDNGVIVGVSGSTSAHRQHAFLWQNGTMTSLGLLGWDGDLWASDINDSGQVVGGAGYGSSGQWYGILWQDRTTADLRVLAGDGRSGAAAINDRGQVVGASGGQAVLWHDDTMADLRVLPGDDTNSASAINDRGQVVGTSYSKPARTGADPDVVVGRPFLWKDGTLTDLGTLAGQESSGAADINTCGQIIGHSGGHLVLWQVPVE